MRKKVILGLSGGVDSAVSLWLLKHDNRYDVEALFIKNWDDLYDLPYATKSDKASDHLPHFANKTEQGCSWAKDYHVAKQIANHLKVKLHFASFEKVYYEQVFKQFIRDYKIGKTPNPDVMCNRIIKFGVVKQYIRTHLNANLFATGHYCRQIVIGKQKFLILAADQGKDQTYFLSGTPISSLQNVIFPIGGLMKNKVRRIAFKQKLINYNRRDSTGICFIGERNFNRFLQTYIAPSPGQIRCLETGKIIGDHSGLPFYTIGQRQNIRVSGSKRFYVVGKNHTDNSLDVVGGRCHQSLWNKKIKIDKIIIHLPFYFQLTAFACFIRIRHRGKLYRAVVYPFEQLLSLVDERVYAAASGQIIAFFNYQICLGSATIK